jgi:hypothetical protein
MLPFQGEEKKGQHPFWKEKGVHKVALVSHAEGRSEDAVAWWCAVVAGVVQCLD